MRLRRQDLAASVLAACLCAMTVLGCGGGGGGNSTPTTPTTPTPPVQQNRSPQISALSVTPTFAVAQLTTVNFSGDATDADGDAVSYTWEIGGQSFAGKSGSATFQNGFSGDARLTVSDGKGGSATDTRQLVVGSMSGEWRGVMDVTSCAGRTKAASASLVQNLTTVTGTINFPEGVCQFAAGNARTDPAEPGRIDNNANVQIRIKIPPFTDFTFRGQMDQSGRRVTGGLFGSGHNGTPLVLDKQ
jgi:hypothetical protein